MATPGFVWLWLGFGSGSMAGLMALGHAAAVMEHHGADPLFVTIGVMVITGTNACGSFAAGWLADRGLTRQAMLGLPLLGWLHSAAANTPVSVFGWFALPQPIAPDRRLVEPLGVAHATLAWLLLGLVALHVLGALKHHRVDRNDTLLRMLPRVGGKRHGGKRHGGGR